MDAKGEAKMYDLGSIQSQYASKTSDLVMLNRSSVQNSISFSVMLRIECFLQRIVPLEKYNQKPLGVKPSFQDLCAFTSLVMFAID